MDEAESFSASIYGFWYSAYQTKSLEQLVGYVKDYERGKELQEHSEKRDIPTDCYLFKYSLASEVSSYEKQVRMSGGGMNEHYKIIKSLELLCERYKSYLRNLTLVKYQELIDYVLRDGLIHKGRVLAMWHFSTIVCKMNPLAHHMKSYFFKKMEEIKKL